MDGDEAVAADLLGALRLDEDARARLAAADAGALTSGLALILTNILHHFNAYLPRHPDDSFFRACAEAHTFVQENEDENEANAPRASDFLAFLALNAGLLQRRLQTPSRHDQDELDAYCAGLFETTHVARVVQRLYDPGLHIATPIESRHEAPEPTDDAKRRAATAWAELDPGTFRFLRAGTTSFIVTCTRRAEENPAYGDRLALKCVLFPWNLIPAIQEDTRAYATTYRGTGRVVVRADSSSDRWVLMPYQEGRTLAEHLHEHLPPGVTTAERIALAKQVAVKVAAALNSLAGDRPVEGRETDPQHLDLSPSNIIMAPGATDEEGEVVRFIDLGRNHLYSRQIGIVDHDDSVYVAPEVKNRSRSATSDVYSLAVILVEILSGVKPRDGRVPDGVYELSPLLGRVLDDALDDEPSRRLLLFRADRLHFGDLRDYLADTFALVDLEPAANRSPAARLWARLAPASHEPWSLWRQYRELSRRTELRPSEAEIRYLTLSSAVATTVWWFIFVQCALFQFDDVIRGSAPSLPDGALVAAAVIAFTQGMTASKYYQSVLARLTTRRIAHPLAMPTEISMRAMTVVALPTAVLAVGWRPELWAWTCAAGAAAVAVTNYTTLELARRLTERGREQFSTVPPQSRQVPGGYEQWWWTMVIYAAIIAVIALGLQQGFLHDEYAYVGGLAVISVGVHYISKCVVGGAAVRGGLARAFAIGERLTILEQRRGT